MTKTKPKLITAICDACATRAGGRMSGLATWHLGACEVCGETKPVTEPRDYRLNSEVCK